MYRKINKIENKLYNNMYKDIDLKLKRIQLYQNIVTLLTTLVLATASFFYYQDKKEYYQDRRETREFIEQHIKDLRTDIKSVAETTGEIASSLIEHKNNIITNAGNLVEKIESKFNSITQSPVTSHIPTDPVAQSTPWLSEQTTQLLITYGFYFVVGITICLLAGYTIDYTVKSVENTVSNSGIGKIGKLFNDSMEYIADTIAYNLNLGQYETTSYFVDAVGNEIMIKSIELSKNAQPVLNFFVKKNGIFVPIREFDITKAIIKAQDSERALYKITENIAQNVRVNAENTIGNALTNTSNISPSAIAETTTNLANTIAGNNTSTNITSTVLEETTKLSADLATHPQIQALLARVTDSEMTNLILTNPELFII